MKKEITHTSRLTSTKSNIETRILITKMEERLSWYFQDLDELINNQAA